MKVLHLIQRYPPAIGGSEQWCREVCRRLAAGGDGVEVLTLDVLEEEEFWREPPVERCTHRLGRLDWDGRVLVRRYRRSLPIPTVHHFVLDRLLDRMLGIHFYGPHSIEMYGRLFARVKAADVVHLHTLPYSHNFVGYLAARLHGKRVVITPYFHPGHPAYERRCHYALLRRCDAVLALSEHERDHLAAHGVAVERIVVTGAGIDVDDYVPADLPRARRALLDAHGLAEATRLVLFVGRKAEYKGLAVLIDAVKRLLDRRDVALVLAGPSLAWFDEMYARLPAADRRRILDLGTVSHQDKVNLLHLADVLVLPSQFESFGIVFPEAWVCGTPVIGTATGPMPDIIGQGGLTFEPGNAGDLAEKIDAVLGDPRRAQAMAAHGLERVHQRYNWTVIAAAVRRAYRPDGGAARRVLICSNLFPPNSIGGAEVVAHRQARLLADLGHEVRVFAGHLAGEPVAGRSRLAGGPEQSVVPLSRRDLDGVSWSVVRPEIAAEFTAVLDRFRPEVVHFHNLAGLSVTLIDACRRRGIPTVLTLHDYWGLCFKNTMVKNDGSLCGRSGLDCLGCRETLATEPPMLTPVRNAHVALALFGVDRLISPSGHLAERYAAHGFPRAKLAVVPNGVELEQFRGYRTRHDVLTLGFVGYLGPHKGAEHLLRALPLVGGVARVRVLIAGTGADEDRLRALCRELSLDASVSFLGWTDHDRIPALYGSIDVLVVPSVWPENSPVTITEAMASGLPVIASDIGGIGELVDEGATGFLVPPGDAPALAARIQHFLAHPEAVEEMGARGFAKIRKHAAKNQARRLAEIYQEVIARPGPPATAEADVVLFEGGEHWSVPVLDMLRRVADVEAKLGRRLLACHAGLVDEETFRQARLLVIPGPGEHVFARAVRALQRQVPLLVHDGVEEVKELCLSAGAGLPYAEPQALTDSLLTLLSDEPLRRTMGANGLRFLEAWKR